MFSETPTVFCWCYLKCGGKEGMYPDWVTWYHYMGKGSLRTAFWEDLSCLEWMESISRFSTYCDRIFLLVPPCTPVSLIGGEESWACGDKKASRFGSVLLRYLSAGRKLPGFLSGISWRKTVLGPVRKKNACHQGLPGVVLEGPPSGDKPTGLPSAAGLVAEKYRAWISFFSFRMRGLPDPLSCCSSYPESPE